MKANSEENKAVLDDVQRTDQVKVSVVYRLWHTFPTENVSAGSECLKRKMNQGVLLLQDFGSEASMLLLLGQNITYYVKIVM